MAEDDIKQRLRALASDDKRRPETARLRDIFEQVEATLRAGVSQSDVLAELHASGFTMTIASFKSALQRIRKERTTSPVKARTEPEPRVSQPAAPSTATASAPETDPGQTPKLTRKQVAEKLGDQYVTDSPSNPYLKRLKEKQDKQP